MYIQKLANTRINRLIYYNAKILALRLYRQNNCLHCFTLDWAHLKISMQLLAHLQLSIQMNLERICSIAAECISGKVHLVTVYPAKLMIVAKILLTIMIRLKLISRLANGPNGDWVQVPFCIVSFSLFPIVFLFLLEYKGRLILLPDLHLVVIDSVFLCYSLCILC